MNDRTFLLTLTKFSDDLFGSFLQDELGLIKIGSRDSGKLPSVASKLRRLRYIAIEIFKMLVHTAFLVMRIKEARPINFTDADIIVMYPELLNRQNIPAKVTFEYVENAIRVCNKRGLSSGRFPVYIFSPPTLHRVSSVRDFYNIDGRCVMSVTSLLTRLDLISLLVRKIRGVASSCLSGRATVRSTLALTYRSYLYELYQLGIKRIIVGLEPSKVLSTYENRFIERIFNDTATEHNIGFQPFCDIVPRPNDCRFKKRAYDRNRNKLLDDIISINPSISTDSLRAHIALLTKTGADVDHRNIMPQRPAPQFTSGDIERTRVFIIGDENYRSVLSLISLLKVVGFRSIFSSVHPSVRMLAERSGISLTPTPRSLVGNSDYDLYICSNETSLVLKIVKACKPIIIYDNDSESELRGFFRSDGLIYNVETQLKCSDPNVLLQYIF